jgi:hypothetical protein
MEIPNKHCYACKWYSFNLYPDDEGDPDGIGEGYCLSKAVHELAYTPDPMMVDPNFGCHWWEDNRPSPEPTGKPVKMDFD